MTERSGLPARDTGRAPSGQESAAQTMLREIELERSQLADLLNQEAVQTLAHVARVLQSLDDVPGTPDPAMSATREAGRLAALVGEQLRAVARRLRPSLLDDLGLEAALGQLAREFSLSSGIAVTTEFHRAPRDLGETELAFFRVAQRALHNAAVPEPATAIRMWLRCRGDRLRLGVWDNRLSGGGGVAPAANDLGLVEMRERMRSIGGALSVRAGRGCGTLVVALARSDPGGAARHSPGW